MKAVVYDQFKSTPKLLEVDKPSAPEHGVVIEVKASGVCRSDWHGWMGHDRDIVTPHVPGHEFAGIISSVGEQVEQWTVGQRVTTPFISGCGACPECNTGNQQVCLNQTQPGFTHWGSFAEYVAVDHADVNLVDIPESMSFVTAASLGCRFATAFRAVVDQGKVQSGDWVSIFGCGGVGLSAIMIAKALGARVIAVDINPKALSKAEELGAEHLINANELPDVVTHIVELTEYGCDVSIDALGSKITCQQGINSLKRRGKQIQIGLMAGDDAQTQLPLGDMIYKEIEFIGSHGMQAHRYAMMFEMIQSGQLAPEKLLQGTITLTESIDALITLDSKVDAGILVIDQFY